MAAEVLPAEARPSLTTAAERYDEVACLALEAFMLRHGPVEENDRVSEISRLDGCEDNPDWDAYWQRADENLADADKRRDLANLIRNALESERKAIAEIEKVLAQLR